MHSERVVQPLDTLRFVATAARDCERARARAISAEAKALGADNEALQAEVGQSVKIAAQRQDDHARAAFT